MTQLIDLRYALGDALLKSYFNRSASQVNDMEEMLDYCRENYAPIYAQKLEYRLQRHEINNIIVDSVLCELPEEHRLIFVKKYKNHEMAQKIALDLSTSIARISSVERAVQANIVSMMLYVLTTADLYSRLKVVNMIHILDLRLSYLEYAPEFAKTCVNPVWAKSLHQCREKYRNLYSAMEDIILRSGKNSLHCDIIAEKLKQPNLTSKELSALCHVSQNGINRHLRRYEDDMQQYLIS